QLGADGMGPDQAVACGRRGLGLKPPADREDGPLQLGRDALGAVMGPGQVVEAFGAAVEIAAPPLVEPSPSAAQSRADQLDRAPCEAQGNGTMTSSQFVVHSYLRMAAASDCLRGYITPAGKILMHSNGGFVSE